MSVAETPWQRFQGRAYAPADPRRHTGEDAEPPPIVIEGLVNRFGDRTIHDGLNLTVEKGEILGVVGGSGTGKSVMLNSIIGLRRPNAGTVKVFGNEIGNLTPAERREVESRWGVLFQSGALFSSLTVKQNVEAALIEHADMPPGLRADVAELKVELVGLPDAANDLKPAELSGGMKKRAGLARALAMDPDLVFLDEPTAGLDPIGAAAFDDLVLELSRSLGLTVFMITHDLDSLYTICDRVAVLADKKVIAVAPVRELEKSDHPWIREYFGGPRGRAAATAKADASAAERASNHGA